MPTGIIAAAGSGSRMWPSTKVFPKELFPIGRLPVLAHVISEMLEAGIENIVIVVRPDNSRLIQTLLDPRIAEPSSLKDDPIARRFAEITARCAFEFVEQHGPYGNGTPLLNAVAHASSEPYVYAFADDVIFGENVSAGLIRTFEQTRSVVLGAQLVPEEDVSKFGILECESLEGVDWVKGFIEKPLPSQTTSRMASLGRYLITSEVVRQLRQTPLGRGGELWLADAFVEMLRQGLPIAAFPLLTGTWHTVGNPDGFANAVVAAVRAENNDFATRKSRS